VTIKIYHLYTQTKLINIIFKLTIAKAPTENLLLNTKTMAIHPPEALLTLQSHLLPPNRWSSQKENIQHETNTQKAKVS